MSKRRIPYELKRVIISARVTPAERSQLIEMGEGNISRGLDKIMGVWNHIASTVRATPALSRPESLS